ncbi:MAG: two-component system, NarL family, sensor kinase, partial [Gaiellaceae bacterium]|nr:two-component system, NarL family, sensor kinase [Gaiellaceae bacterium]
AADVRRAFAAHDDAGAVPQAKEPMKPEILAGQGTTGRRIALYQWAFSVVLLLIVIGTVGAYMLRRVATDQAIRDARTLTQVVGDGVLRPALNPQVLAGDRAALTEFDKIVRERALIDPIVRVKVWTETGKVVYSDEKRLIGQTYPLTEDQVQALDDGTVKAEVSGLTLAENDFERNRGRLMEVYLPLRLASGDRVLVETYQVASRIDASSNRIWRAFVPVFLVTLAALAIAQLPLGYWLARRIRSEQRRREVLARRADQASADERRRIASELHDGPLQDLAGIAFELGATADRIEDDSDLRRTLRRGASVSRESMRSLRTLLVDLYPQDRRDEGMDAALDALAQPLRSRGVAVQIDTRVERPLDHDTEEIVYRAAQEALRNVVRHAAATAVEISLSANGNGTKLTIADDGRGMSAADLAEQRAAGHMGLALLADRVQSLGGQVAIASEPGRGTRVSVEIP